MHESEINRLRKLQIALLLAASDMDQAAAAARALEDCLRDEPQWRGLLRVEEIELSTNQRSLN